MTTVNILTQISRNFNRCSCYYRNSSFVTLTVCCQARIFLAVKGTVCISAFCMCSNKSSGFIVRTGCCHFSGSIAFIQYRTTCHTCVSDFSCKSSHYRIESGYWTCHITECGTGWRLSLLHVSRKSSGTPVTCNNSNFCNAIIESTHCSWFSFPCISYKASDWP